MIRLAAALAALAVPAGALADAGPITTSLSNPGDQLLNQVFAVRVAADLPGGRAEWKFTSSTGATSLDPIVTPEWSIGGAFSATGVEPVGDPVHVRAGDSYFLTQNFRCTEPGAASVSFSGRVYYNVVAGGGILRFGDIALNENGQAFRCLGTSTSTPADAVAGYCDPPSIATDYGTFVGRIWRRPGTDPLPIPEKTVVTTELANTSRRPAFATVTWNLSGDLWEHAGTGVTPRHANNGQHPWLYVGSPDAPYRASAEFTCANPDVAGLMHVLKIRWPDQARPTGPMREATMTCYVHPFRCGRER